MLFGNHGNQHDLKSVQTPDEYYVPMWRLSLNKDLGAVSIRKTVLPGVAIPMLKIRRPNGRLIFNIGIAIPR